MLERAVIVNALLPRHMRSPDPHLGTHRNGPLSGGQTRIPFTTLIHGATTSFYGMGVMIVVVFLGIAVSAPTASWEPMAS